MTTQTHTPDDPSSDKPFKRRNRWENSKVPERRRTAHKRNGDQCGNPAIHGGNVCGYHGGNAPAVKAKARLRLEMAAERLAHQLLKMTTDPNVADPMKLPTIRDALDRSGIQAKTAVSVQVSTRPFELVFDAIAAGPRSAACIRELLADMGHLPPELVGRVGHGFLFRWWTNPILGLFVLVVTFWAFCPACGVRLAGQVRVGVRQSESSMWASIRSV